MRKGTIAHQTMMLALCGGLESDALTENSRKLVLALKDKGVTQGDVSYENGVLTVSTRVRGEPVTIRVSAEKFDVDEEQQLQLP